MDRKRLFFLAAFLMLCGSIVAGQNALADEHQGQKAQPSQKEETAKQQLSQGEQGERAVLGKVVDQRQIQLKEGEAKHHLVKLENPQGKTIVVDLGAATEEMDLKKGDRLFAVGKSARINERPVIYAKYAGEINSVGSAAGKEE